jgi:hypothetical protein
MTCRLFIDEVGNDDIDHPAEQYLSLTGIMCNSAGHNNHIRPKIEAAKAKFFGHNPPNKVVILHRRELVRHEPPFEALQDAATNAAWEQTVLQLVENLPYTAITVMIDKHEHKDRYKVWHHNPYHYCLTALIERYVMQLKQDKERGDVVAEPRFKRVDKALKKAFEYIWTNGTGNVSPQEVQAHLTSKELKFAAKTANACGLQLVELIAHASHHGTRAEYTGVPMKANFGKQVYDLLVAAKLERTYGQHCEAGFRARSFY